MRRREFVTLVGGAALGWPLTARAQQPEQSRRIGVLMGLAANDPEAQPRIAAFQRRLQELGWTAGRNITVEYRWAGGDFDRMRAYALELIGFAPDVIVAHSPEVLRAVQQQTRSIPIVFVQVSDPVGGGFVENLAHPGANITGFTTFEPEMSGKWLEFLKEIAPSVSRVLILQDPRNSAWPGQLRAIAAVAPSLHVEVTPVYDLADVERAVKGLAGGLNVGVLVLPSLVATTNRERLVALIAEHHLPAIFPFRYFANMGGLASYGIDLIDLYSRAASYVDRILKGANPAELPVQEPTKFELVVNLKTATALGLTVPPSLLARANEVIE